MSSELHAAAERGSSGIGRMGMPAPKRPKRLTTRIKGKPVEVDLAKSGIGTGKVLIDILTDRGHSVVEITRVEPPVEDAEQNSESDS